jgi:hypothetical protein
MTPARNKPTDGAMRAAKQIHNLSFLQSTAEIIDRETGVRELADILENIITEAGDLIESRSPELAAQARVALRRYSDGSSAPGRIMPATDTRQNPRPTSPRKI